MDHSVLTILDLGIIAAYLVIMVLVGVYSVRRIQNTKDYYCLLYTSDAADD